MTSEPPVDRVVGAIQLARARAKYRGVAKGVAASLLDIQWMLDETSQTKADLGALDRETHMLVRRYLEMEVPYRMQQLKEFLRALEGVGIAVEDLPQKLEGLEKERERQALLVGPEPGERSESAGAKEEIEELTKFARELDSVGEELDGRAYRFLVAFIEENKLSKELASSLLEREEIADS